MIHPDWRALRAKLLDLASNHPRTTVTVSFALGVTSAAVLGISVL